MTKRGGGFLRELAGTLCDAQAAIQRRYLCNGPCLLI